MSVTDDDQFAAYGGANYDYLAMGPSRFGFVTMASGNDPNFRVGCSAGGNIYGVFGYAGPGRDDGDTIGPATNTYTQNAGVYGTSLQFTGVAGAADALQPGVYGQFGDVSGLPPGLTAGVLGASSLAAGVHGWSQADHGVEGESETSTGVWGASRRAYGVIGQTGGAPFGPRFSDPNSRVSGDQRSVPAGVWGTATATFGVAGSSFKASGVLGQSGAPPAFDPKVNHTGGVTGTSRDAAGVVAVSQNGFGVVAISQVRAGVAATSQKAAGVYAASGTNSGVFGISGVAGPIVPNPALPHIAGVIGSSGAQPGVIGTSKAQFGVYGFSNDAVGVFGQTANPASYAGAFLGNVLVSGAFAVTGAKGAAVPFPDGTRRLLYCMESPELWFEDLGTAKLKRGRVVIKLDADFAVVITRDYRVFLTPEGDCRGLFVRRKTAADFEVRELMGGKSNVAFSYRIVGRRKDIKGHRRFAKIDTRVPSPPRAIRGRAQARSSSAMGRLVERPEKRLGTSIPARTRRRQNKRA
jgi:hypothetical protein